MSYFYQAVNQLIHQIRHAPEGATRCVQVLKTPPSFELLDWLETQPLFPKFYWQDRHAEEDVVALGQWQIFLDPASAYPCLDDEQRIWGGRSFDGQTKKNPAGMASFFFLPLIELSRTGDVWRLVANISWQDSLVSESHEHHQKHDHGKTADENIGHEKTERKDRIIRALESLTTDAPPLKGIQAEITAISHLPDESAWCALVEQALSAIKQQAFHKVVLARRSTYTLAQPIRAAQLLKASCALNHHSFHFLLAMDETQSFIGSTPERLYQRHGQSLETEALAGTIGRGETTAQDHQLADWLIHDEKNIKENQYVVDDIVDRLAPLSLSIDVETSPQLVPLCRVQHLRRKIQAILKPESNGVQLLSTLQPTAAVAGVPRVAARAFIEQYEPFPRGWYAGSMGYISHQQAEFCVAIRSALISENQVKLYAGAGIIPGSSGQEEWSELDRKMSTLLSLITNSCVNGIEPNQFEPSQFEPSQFETNQVSPNQSEPNPMESSRTKGTVL